MTVGKADGQVVKDRLAVHAENESEAVTTYTQASRDQWVLTFEGIVSDVTEGPEKPVKLVGREYEGGTTRLTFRLPLNYTDREGLGYEGRSFQFGPQFHALAHGTEQFGGGRNSANHPEFVGESIGRSLAWTFRAAT